MIIVLLANGFEEIEALTPVDILRRAGLEVKTVGIDGRAPTGAHGISVICDALPEDIDLSKVTMAIFPGGMPGAVNLDKSEFTDKVIGAIIKRKGRLAAICAAPLVLGRRGLLYGKKAVCYPGFEDELQGAIIEDCEVVTDGNITTAKGMGVALSFAEELVSLCKDKATAEQISASICKHTPDLIDFLTFAAECPEIDTVDEDSEICDSFTAEENDLKADQPDYSLPSTDLLAPDGEPDVSVIEDIEKQKDTIIKTLNDFGVNATVSNYERGPRITRFEISPERGVKANQIINLQDDIALSLGVRSIRVDAPIPGKAAIGMEVPRPKGDTVGLRGLLESDEFVNSSSDTLVALGRDVSGRAIYADIAKMPHLLIAGATGMGKSVLINSILTSLLYKSGPEKVRFILIDPKQVEYTCYKDIPHLLTPIINTTDDAVKSLTWAVDEVERRFGILDKHSARNIDAYNLKVENGETEGKVLPKILIVIDELADLMLMAKSSVEPLIMRIAQKARATGIHLIIGTQRPSVSVITGCIKANIPTRISFKVVSSIDSKVVIDMAGAEKLMDKGDALYLSLSSCYPSRMQSAYISDSELEAITKSIKEKSGLPIYQKGILDTDIAIEKKPKRRTSRDDQKSNEHLDETFIEAVEIALEVGKISTSVLQRRLMIGYGKAAKFIDMMEEMGIVSCCNGAKPRELLVTSEECWRILSKNKISKK